VYGFIPKLAVNQIKLITMKGRWKERGSQVEAPKLTKSFDNISGFQETGFDEIEIKKVKSGRLAFATEVGGRTGVNQDAIYFDTESDVFVIADGMGGYDLGEVASRITCEEIARGLTTGTLPYEAHMQAMRRMKEADIKQGGSVYVAGRIIERALRVRVGGDCKLWVLNEKYEVVGETKIGSVGDGPRAISPGRSTEETFPLQNYFRILAVTDGILDNVLEAEILETVKNKPVNQGLRELAAMALQTMKHLKQRSDGAFGNPDNITAFLYEILPHTLRGK
jgi:serine/threonine protein phosphatase PrpC